MLIVCPFDLRIRQSWRVHQHQVLCCWRNYFELTIVCRFLYCMLLFMTFMVWSISGRYAITLVINFVFLFLFPHRWWSDISMHVQRHPTVCAPRMPWPLAICQGKVMAYWSLVFIGMIYLKPSRSPNDCNSTGRFCLFPLHDLQSSVSSSSCWAERQLLAQD